ncbi:hypothetical protein Bca52824_060541 [Brassica carinata]|uniref:Trichome birefringence-like C-terminal domain-containing protein n=1 Tax=Brassica carinata TaxID=52824 RepID=A0A8X7UJA5_BRACI|nr:hypothetical protein Bca52824_060541 [Brassica carinata]
MGGRPILPPVPPADGLDRVPSNMVHCFSIKKRSGGIIFFRTQSSRHFEGGDWDQGGTCQRLQPLLPGEVEELFSVRKNGTNVEIRLVNQHLYNSLKSRRDFHVLDLTGMSEYRADAHPATAGEKNHDDCIVLKDVKFRDEEKAARAHTCRTKTKWKNRCRTVSMEPNVVVGQFPLEVTCSCEALKPIQI